MHRLRAVVAHALDEPRRARHQLAAHARPQGRSAGPPARREPPRERASTSGAPSRAPTSELAPADSRHTRRAPPRLRPGHRCRVLPVARDPQVAGARDRRGAVMVFM